MEAVVFLSRLCRRDPARSVFRFRDRQIEFHTDGPATEKARSASVVLVL